MLHKALATATLASAVCLVFTSAQSQETEKQGFLTFSAGHSEERGAIVGVGAQFQNLFGGAADLSFDAERSDDGYRLSADIAAKKSVTVPFTGAPGRLSFSIFSDVNNWEESLFNTERTGIRTGLAFGVGANSAARISYVLYQDTISDVAPTTFELIDDTAGKQTASGVELGWSYSTVDDPVTPRIGFVVSFDAKVFGLGGDAEWASASGAISLFRPVSAASNLRLSLGAGSATHYGDGELRITDRAFVGGTSPRGFAYRGIGPRFADANQNLALGGERYVTATLEYAHDLGTVGDNQLRGLVFVDSGSVWKLGNTAHSGGTIDDSFILRTSAGIGLSLATTHGAFDIYLADALQAEDFDGTQPVSFSLRLKF